MDTGQKFVKNNAKRPDIAKRGVFAEFVNSDDIFVMQISRRHRFGSKTADETSIAQGGKNFNGDHALDGGVIAPVHVAEASVPQLPGYFVTSDAPDHAKLL